MAIAGILVGVAMIIFGFSMWYDTEATYRNTITFGGDFYTEIYELVELVRRGTVAISNTVQECIGILTMLLGGVDICAFGCVLAMCGKKKENLNNVVIDHVE